MSGVAADQDPTAVVMERLEKIRWHRSVLYPAGDTLAELSHAAEWVRRMGHEAADVCEEGFRYRSVYSDGNKSRWRWIEPDQWLVHMEGDRQDREFDEPSDEGPASSDNPDDDGYYGWRPWPEDEWHRVTPDAPSEVPHD